MAPETRRSNSSGITRKTATRKQRAPVVRNTSNSWDFINTNNNNHNDDVRESVEIHGQNGQDAHMDSSSDVEEALKPLREMADKVGREVEQFAEQFDQFIADLPTRQNQYEAAKEIVLTFKIIADEAAGELKKGYQKERVEQLKREWSERAQLSGVGNAHTAAGSGLAGSKGGVMSGLKAEKVQELRQWQQEADIWQLFYTVIEFWYNRDARRREKDDKLANMPVPHRYSTERKIWERFLLENEIAKEHTLFKRWLEETADHQESDLPDIMQELEARSGAKGGLWNRGWMSTREAIKKEKRMRAWPSPDDAVLPQIRSSAGNEMLITTLDPDAPSRQDRTLETLDKYFERAMWIACWEMLRRGKPWEEIVAWCEEHNEGWRAAILAPAMGQSDALSNVAWRKMCYLASESACSSDYEAAVYGLLGGNVKAVQKVCRTVDDNLFAHYSCTLARQFDLYLQNDYASRIPSLALQRKSGDNVLDHEDQAQDAITGLIFQLRGERSQAKEEAVTPLKIIEGYLLANSAEDLANTVGTAISDLDSLRNGHEETVVRIRRPPQQLIPEAELAVDSHALRIATHIWLILMAIDDGKGPHDEPDSLTAEENVLVAYLQTLRLAGKRELTPLYASRLRPGRAVVVLSRVLQDVVRPDEQRTMLDLMRGADLPVDAVVTEQLRWVLRVKVPREEVPETLLHILEGCEVSQLHPGQRIMDGFLDDSLTEDDVAVVRCLQWYQLIKGHWALTFEALARALRTCLLAGRIACALQIVNDFPYESISEQKSASVLGENVNVMDKSRTPLDSEAEEALEWQLLQRQSRSYYELEQLVRAIEGLAMWVSNERPYTTAPKRGSSAPSALKQAKAHMDECMAPLLNPGILLQAGDEQEKLQLDSIRTAYIPEIIIAYNTALYTAGPTITRDAYIESMDLSVSLASNEANGLAATITRAGRMRELVQTFAHASKMMLVMKASGRPRKPGKGGRDLGLWEIGPQGAIAAGDDVRDADAL